MTIKQALIKYKNIEIDLLLSFVLKKDREFLYLSPAHRLTRKQTDKLTRIANRRVKGEPIAYILGYKDFYGLRFKVNKNVLIPRPETEEIVKSVKLKVESWEQKKIKILDVGTGSGCIAIAIAKQVTSKRLQVTGSDISAPALKVAKENAKKHHTKIKFIQSDLFKNIKGKFDIVIANLPYVPRRIYDLRFEDLRFEPEKALIDLIKDFNIYERFFQQISKILNPKSRISLEIDPKAKSHITKWAKKYLPQAKVNFQKDLNGLWRYAEIHMVD